MTVTAIVLAGGRSTRFGGDKLAATFQGRSILEATLAAVAPVADAILVAGRSDAAALDLAERRTVVVPDAAPFAGPLVALAGALESLAARPAPGLALVVAGDMPRLVPRVLVAMLDVLDQDDDLDAVYLGTAEAATAEASAEQPRRQVLPLALRVQPASRAAREAVEAGDRSLRALLDRITAVELPEASWLPLDAAGATLTDVDTPADLDRMNRA